MTVSNTACFTAKNPASSATGSDPMSDSDKAAKRPIEKGRDDLTGAKPPRPRRPQQSPARCRTSGDGRGADFDARETELMAINADERELVAINAEKDMFVADGSTDPSNCNTGATYIEEKYGKYMLDTTPVERPRSTTPINLASLTDYVRNGATTGDNLVDECNIGKMTITLPGDEFSSRPKSPRKSEKESSSPWSDFPQGLLFREADDNVDTQGDPQNTSVLLPRSKRQAPAPPATQKARAPPVPPPPSKSALSANKTSWETFEKTNATNVSCTTTKSNMEASEGDDNVDVDATVDVNDDQDDSSATAGK